MVPKVFIGNASDELELLLVLTIKSTEDYLFFEPALFQGEQLDVERGLLNEVDVIFVQSVEFTGT